ncbi:hypothetical protein ACP4OV_019782 [Aristida adscensionis]
MAPPASPGKRAGAGKLDEPLLPEFSGGGGHGGGGAAVSGAVFNVSTSIVGAGIMSIPAAMRVLGVAPALLLIAAVAALADVSVEFMLRYTGLGDAKPTYAGLMRAAFGRAGGAVLNVCIAFTTTGTLVVYLIIIGDVMSGSVGGGDEHAGVLQELFGARWWTAREFVLLVTAVFVLLPLVLRRRVGIMHEVAQAGGSASVTGAVFNVATSVVGAGIMSIPAAMRVLGVAPALLLIAGVAALANAAVDFMLRYTRGAPSYAALMGDAFGRAGAALLNVFVAFNAFGTLTVYLIIIGDVMSGAAGGGGGGGDAHAGVLPEWFGRHWWTSREVVLVAAAAIVLPLVLRKRVDSLRFTSAISILLAVVFMLISLGIAVYALFTGTAKMPRMLPDFSTLSSPFELFTAVPVIVVAFTFHFNVHPIRAELSKTSDMKAAVRISLVLCAAIYAAVGFFGYLLFGDATMDDVLANFDRSSGAGVPQALNDAARLSYALHLVLVFPLLLFSLRVNVDELLFPGRRPLATDTRRFVSLTAVLMAVLYALAIAIPSIWTLFEYSGSTFAVTISLIFPGAIVLRDVHGIAKRKDKALAATMIILAVITSSIAIGSNIMSSISSSVRGGQGS